MHHKCQAVTFCSAAKYVQQGHGSWITNLEVEIQKKKKKGEKNHYRSRTLSGLDPETPAAR